MNVNKDTVTIINSPGESFAIVNLSKEQVLDMALKADKVITTYEEQTKVLEKAIIKNGEVRKYDWLVFVISLISIVLSALAIIKTGDIAKKQNDIALFEKRYEAYQELSIINQYVVDICSEELSGLQLEQIPHFDKYSDTEKDEALNYEIWMGEVWSNYHKDLESANSVLNKQKQIISSIDLIFENITQEERNLYIDYLNNYCAMIQKSMIVYEDTESYSLDKSTNDYKYTFETEWMKDFLLKLRGQLDNLCN